MGGSLSVRELRNSLSEVLRRVEAGERFTITVDRRPVAELTPFHRRRAAPVQDARNAASRHPADRGLLDDLADALPDTTDDA